MSLLDSLVSYWKFDENTTGNRADSHGPHTLNAVGSPQPDPGILGYAVRVGTSTWLYVDDHPDFRLGTSDLTISLWAYTTTPADDVYLVYKGDTNIEFAVRMVKDPSGYYYYEGLLKDSASMTQPLIVRSANAWTSGAWRHLVFVIKNGVEIEFYSNATRTANSWSGTTSGFTSSGKYCVGCRISGGYSVDYFPGRIDEMGFWRRALSQSEVSELYNSANALSYPFGEVPAKGAPFLMFLGI